MIIKIARPNPTPVSSEEKDLKFRPEVSWLTIECTRFKHHMIPRGDYVADEGYVAIAGIIPNEVLLTVHNITRIDGKPDEPIIDELCVLEVEAPNPFIVVFDTVAYVCNDNGQTMERIQPQRKVLGQPIKLPPAGSVEARPKKLGFGHLKKVEPFSRPAEGETHPGPYRCTFCKVFKKAGECPECGQEPAQGAPHQQMTWPCLECEKEAIRLFQLFFNQNAEWIGTLCDEHGELVFKEQD